ncbi:transmembrane amino acid transporter protein-domain-containing protein [Tribonema minus]|uniref:Transmembrane amino acid transporter protein-domain-containing protein n=1 Tax=Tribonema minus TaxID=303371 RepID=A0A835ZAV6_9STRA|nr:transmembrane amino acid transporter protein-domain-containing protein [Tribonema minus]
MRRPQSQEELFFPFSFHSEMRVGSVTGAVLNLISTVLGGGVLSLPFALQRAGLIPGLALLVLTALASDFSVYILVSCSRRSGAQSFEEVAEKAFGPRAKRWGMALIICVTYLPLIAYIILMRDLVAPVVELYVLGGATMSRGARNLLAAALVAAVFPVCLVERLHGLRAACLVSIASITMLAVAIITRAAQCVGAAPRGALRGAVNLWPRDGASGALQSVPIWICAFVCHFNVLPVHGALARPTRRRLHRTVHFTMGLVAAFYAAIGVAGYLYAACVGALGASDNILAAFDPADGLVNAGRLGLVVTIMLSFPLLVVPCRDALLRVHADCRYGAPRPSRRRRRLRSRHSETAASSDDSSSDGGGGDGDGDGGAASDHDAFANLEVSLLTPTSDGGRETVKSSGGSPRSSGGGGSGAGGEDAIATSLCLRAALTAPLLGSALALASLITRVTDVWGVLGSSVNVVVAFCVPAAAYLAIRRRAHHNARSRARRAGAAALLVVSACLAVACTANNVYIIASR